MTWRPFNTAPHDGTEILVYRPDAGVFMAWYVSPADILHMENPSEDDQEESWWSYDGVNHLVGAEEPTHWMPLPAAPSS
jgi:hypothetical protein